MKYAYKQIWLINLPIMVSLLMEQLINFTDSIFLGHVSQIDLGASALATMYYTAIYMLGFGFSLGTQVVIARRNGEGQYTDAGRVFYQGLIFLSVSAVVVFILSKLLSPVLLRMTISMLFFVIVNSFATTTISLVGNLIGAKQTLGVMPLCRRVILMTYAMGIPLILLSFAFSETLLGLFTDDETVVLTAFYPFCVMLSTFIISVPAYIYCNAAIGTGNTKIVFVFQMINIITYLSYLFALSHSPNISLAVYWTSEQIYVLALLLMSYIYMKKGRWLNKSV